MTTNGIERLSTLDWRVQVTMVFCVMILGVSALICGNSTIAMVAIISFSPTPVGMLLSFLYEFNKSFKVIK